MHEVTSYLIGVRDALEFGDYYTVEDAIEDLRSMLDLFGYTYLLDHNPFWLQAPSEYAMLARLGDLIAADEPPGLADAANLVPWSHSIPLDVENSFPATPPPSPYSAYESNSSEDSQQSWDSV